MLPQQSLMLKVAAEASRDARWDDRLALSTGVLIGIGLDLNTTNYHLRWSLAGQARRWNQTLALGLSDDELRSVDRRAQERGRAGAFGEPDDRLARRHGRQPDRPRAPDRRAQLHGLVRRDIRACRHWRSPPTGSSAGELDAAIVGAVDLAGDLRARSGAANQLWGQSAFAGDHLSPPCDGAVALVLKRLEDARRDGDRVYAVLRRVRRRLGPCLMARLTAAASATSTSSHPLHLSRRSRRGLHASCLDRCAQSGAEDSFALGSIEGDLGAAGAASGWRPWPRRRFA